VLSLILIGSFIEKVIGTLKTIILWFTTCIVGAAFAIVIQPNPSVGASIAIYGLIGAYVNKYNLF
jgi:membrane associated rhomboid family serine protease